MSDQRDGGIAWTDQTWNPTRGCKAVSPGCANCYAAGVAARFSGSGQPYEGLAKRTAGKALAQWTGKGLFVPDHLADPLRWTRPRRVFVNSMSDLFFEEFTVEQIAAVWAVMMLSPRHTYQVLTKRPDRMLRVLTDPHFYDAVLDAATPLRAERPMLTSIGMSDPTRWPARWIWLGVSAENQETADERIPLLLQCPAAVRFVSAEPLLDDLDLSQYLEAGRCEEAPDERLDWVIVGGESGNRARPCCLSWIRNVVHDCEAANVACFVKQLGSRPYECADETVELADVEWVKTKHSKGGDPAEWGSYIQVQQFPQVSP